MASSLLQALEAAAKKKGLSLEKELAYQAWIIGYICWRLRHSSDTAGAGRRERFLESVRQHPQSAPYYEKQAASALAFLFGPVQEEMEEEFPLTDWETSPQ